MKFYIAVDCEGVAGVVGQPHGTLNDSPDYALACRQATREANAVARGLFAAGAEEVVIWDNHGTSLNLVIEDLDERCLIASGLFPRRFPGLDETFSGVALVGYHARDNTPEAVICHTFSSLTYQWMKINGHEVGEIEIDAALCGLRGVPVFFVSSDDKACSQVQEVLPWATTHETKRAFSYNAAISKHPLRVAREMESAAQEAASRCDVCRPFAFAAPLTLQIRFTHLEAVQSYLGPGSAWRRLDAYTIERTLNQISDYF